MPTTPQGYKATSPQGTHTIRGRKAAGLTGQAKRKAKMSAEKEALPSSQRRTKTAGSKPVAPAKARAKAKRAAASKRTTTKGDAAFRGVVEKIDKGY